jgi:hypothetical protein
VVSVLPGYPSRSLKAGPAADTLRPAVRRET